MSTYGTATYGTSPYGAGGEGGTGATVATAPSLTAVEVVGRYVNLDGAPTEGTVTFVLSEPLRVAADGVIVVPRPFVVDLDAAGDFSVLLPATDDPDAAPSSTTYSVIERFLNAQGADPYALVIPHGAQVDIYDHRP